MRGFFERVFNSRNNNSNNSNNNDPSKKEINNDKQISKLMQRDNKNEERIQTLLLLGAGESGKTTLMKQMRHIYGKPYETHDRRMYRDNCIEQMKTLITMSDALSEGKIDDCAISKENLEHKKKIISLPDISSIEFELTKDIAFSVNKLWNDSGIQYTFKYNYNNDNKHQFYYIMDTTPYLFDNIKRFIGKEYVPTFEDFTRLRVRTLAIREENFIFENLQFKVIDVGGQRNERKKWIHHFDKCNAVIYVCSLAGYNQVIFEDTKTNKLEESLNVFVQYLNHKFFRSKNIILFLNKYDLFEKSIQEIEFVFENFEGNGNDKDSVIKFITKLFISKTKGIETKQRQLYSHVTVATNTENIKHVFNDMKHAIVSNRLRNANLV